MEQTRRDIEAETRRAIQEIRDEVADLTVLATEKVTRKSLDRRRPAAARRGGARRARLRRARRARSAASHGRDRRGLRPLAVRGRQGAGQARRRPRAARRVRRRARRTPASCRCSSSRRTSRRRRRRTGSTARSPAPTRSLVNFLKLLIEKHRMPVIFRIRRELRRAVGGGEQAAAGRRSPRPSSSTRPPSSSIGDRIAEQTGRKVELSAQRRSRHPRRHRRPGRQLDPRRLDPQPPRTTSQASRA